jgi:hypothetical protein
VLGHNNALPATTEQVIHLNGKVNPNGNTVTNSKLFFSVEQQKAGAWGSNASTADIKSDDFFTGIGLVVVTSYPNDTSVDLVAFDRNSVYPNPTSERVYFEIIPEDSRIVLLDMAGRSMLVKNASELTMDCHCSLIRAGFT